MQLIAQTLFHETYDNPQKWANDDTWKRPSFNVAEYQKKIDEIVGKSRGGHSIVVLRWMRDSECYERFYTDWDTEGTPIKHELRARYNFLTVDLPNGDTVDIPPPRWVFEQRYEPEQIAEEWNTARWEMKDGRPVPIRDACPAIGYYQWLWTIAHHTPTCCEDGITAHRTICWGRYREPSEKDLTVLKAMMWRKTKDDMPTNPFEKVSTKTHDMVLKRAAEMDAVREAKKQELRKDILSDAMNQSLHKFTDDPSVLKHGKYRFVPSSYKSQIKNKKRRKKP